MNHLGRRYSSVDPNHRNFRGVRQQYCSPSRAGPIPLFPSRVLYAAARHRKIRAADEYVCSPLYVFERRSSLSFNVLRFAFLELAPYNVLLRLPLGCGPSALRLVAEAGAGAVREAGAGASRRRHSDGAV